MIKINIAKSVSKDSDVELRLKSVYESQGKEDSLLFQMLETSLTSADEPLTSCELLPVRLAPQFSSWEFCCSFDSKRRILLGRLHALLNNPPFKLPSHVDVRSVVVYSTLNRELVL